MKTRSIFDVFADGLMSITDSVQDVYSDIKIRMEDRRIQRASLAISAIKVLVAADPVMSTMQFTVKALQAMFPMKKGDYTIDYSNPYFESCPNHHCITYRVKETDYVVWCPLCMEFLEVG